MDASLSASFDLCTVGSARPLESPAGGDFGERFASGDTGRRDAAAPAAADVATSATLSCRGDARSLRGVLFSRGDLRSLAVGAAA
jgi:hypothetical protein